MRLLAVLLYACALACSSSTARQGDKELTATHPALARQLAYTHTHEVRFGNSQVVAGYLVEYLILPEGMADTRDFPAGTVLLQNPNFVTIGLITPGNDGLAFDSMGEPTHLGHAGRDQQVMAVFGRSERPRFTSILPGLPPARPQP